jgi:hypothetical protein
MIVIPLSDTPTLLVAFQQYWHVNCEERGNLALTAENGHAITLNLTFLPAP